MAQQPLYNPILCIVKASVIVFLLRLGDRRKAIRWSLLAFFCFNLGSTISVFVVALTQCLPIHMYWDHYKTDQIIGGKTVNNNYHCFNEEVFSLTTAGLAILIDILILTIPVAMMWDLRLPLRKKLAVIAMMSLGWAVTVIGIVRLKIFYDYWAGLSGIEVNVAMITSCGPAMRACIARFSPRFFGTHNGSRPTGNVYYSPQGYELSGRAPAKKPNAHHSYTHKTASRPAEAQDNDADSQEAIIKNDSLGLKTSNTGQEMDIEAIPVGTGGGNQRGAYSYTIGRAA